MAKSTQGIFLPAGTQLSALYGVSDVDGDYWKEVVGSRGCTGIVVKYVSGPSSTYAVANVSYDDGKPDGFYPIHHLEKVEFADGYGAHGLV